jgi:hypothetical protein
MAKISKSVLPALRETDDNSDVHLIGIACHLRDYRICWLINERTDINLRRIDDLSEEARGRKTEGNQFQVYFYENGDKMQQYFLVGNHGPAGNLLEKYARADYLLLVSGMNKADEAQLVRKIRSIQQVLTAFKIDLNKIPDAELILSDLEMLLLGYTKKNLI